jgi:hypothetical protein
VNPPVLDKPTLPPTMRGAGWAIISAAALTTATNGGGATALLAVVAALLALHLFVAVVLAAVTARIALAAVRAGQDPVRILGLLVSLLRSTR